MRGRSADAIVAAALLAWLAIAALPAPATAWKQSTSGDSGVCLAWGDRSVTWRAASPLGGALGEEESLDAFRRSFAVWEAEGCTDLRFVEGQRAKREAAFESGRQNSNVLLFRDRSCDSVVPAGDRCIADRSCANRYDCWEFDRTVIAMTTVTSSNCSGEIIDADIELNAAGFRFTAVDGPRCAGQLQEGCVEMDLENTLVHEIGHLIGLDHSSDPEATMYRSASAGETIKRTLAADDRNALCAVYSKGRAVRTCGGALTPAQCEARRQRYESTSTCASAGGGAATASLVAAVAAALLRRRSRQPG